MFRSLEMQNLAWLFFKGASKGKSAAWPKHYCSVRCAGPEVSKQAGRHRRERQDFPGRRAVVRGIRWSEGCCCYCCSCVPVILLEVPAIPVLLVVVLESRGGELARGRVRMVS